MNRNKGRYILLWCRRMRNTKGCFGRFSFYFKCHEVKQTAPKWVKAVNSVDQHAETHLKVMWRAFRHLKYVHKFTYQLDLNLLLVVVCSYSNQKSLASNKSVIYVHTVVVLETIFQLWNFIIIIEFMFVWCCGNVAILMNKSLLIPLKMPFWRFFLPKCWSSELPWKFPISEVPIIEGRDGTVLVHL